MARQFATGDSITVAAGGAAGSSSNHTIVALVQIVGTPGSNASVMQGLASTTRVWQMMFDNNHLYGLNDFGNGGAAIASNTWYVVAIGKASGNQHFQYHSAPLSTGVWTHTDGGFNVGDGSGGTTSIQFGVSQTTGGNVALAAVAEYSGNLSNAAIEALGVTSMDTWLAASPRAAWQFNQASTSDSVTDLTGSGADQTAISGTSVVTDPAGWSYSTGGGGAVDLTAQDATHTHGAEAPTLAQVHRLTGQDSAHIQAAESPALAQVHHLTAQDATHGQLSNQATLTQIHQLVVQDAAHGQAAEVPTVAGGSTLAAADASHGHTTGSVLLAQLHQLIAQDTLHTHVADGPALIQVHHLAAQGAAHAHSAETPTLGLPGAVVHRPNTGTITRPDTGTVTRPNTGTVGRP